jgi:fructan beta-fructosidase
MLRLIFTAIFIVSFWQSGWNPAFAADDLLIADFESTTYGDWQVTGTAFGDGPVGGAINGQMSVTGFKGKRLVNSFHGGDQATGTLTSPEFSIARPFINLLIGGGGYAGETEVQLHVGDEIVRTATGPNTQPGGSEELTEYSWDVAALIGQNARIRVVDKHTGGWGHINVDDIRQSDQRSAPELLKLEKELLVDDRYLLVPVSNYSRRQNVVRLNLYSGEELVQNFNVSLPLDGDAYWLAAYPLSPFGVEGKRLTIRPATAAMSTTAIQASFERIRIGSQDEAWAGDDYEQPYRNQFHISTRRGWNNDPNGMVYHDGKYHLYYQYNPFGIFWGNMHWGHFISDDMIHWKEKPIALFQKTERDMMFSGGGFVDHDNTAGYGENTLFIAFTSTGRGECLAYSTDGGQTFTEIPENPVVKHSGRDPKIIWYAPQQKWVMVVYNEDESELTKSTPFNENMKHHKNANLAFYESKDLHTWTMTGAFTDYDRESVFECPEFFELPIEGQPGESRWCLMAATNRYFIGTFDGKVFQKESGPHGQRRGAFYAPQTFSDTPDGRRIQMGWIQPASFEQQVPDQISNQAFSLPHQMTLRRTAEGLRLFCTPVKEVDTLRAETLASGSDLDAQAAEKLLQACANELTEVVIELSAPAKLQLRINGIDATFEGGSARIYNDRTVNEVYVDQGREYRINARDAKQLGDNTTTLQASADVKIQSLKVYRLKSIF